MSKEKKKKNEEGKKKKEYRTPNKEYRMSKGKKKKNEEGKKKIEYRISKEGSPKARYLPAAGVYLPEGRLPSTFGVPCSLFDIPAEGGSILVVEDTSESLYFINTRDWQTVKKISKAGLMSAAPAVNMLAGVSPGYKMSTVKFFSMTDGSQKGEVKFPAKVTGIGLSAIGNRLVLLANGPKEKEAKKPVPKNLKSLEADIFKQKNDGKVSIIAEFDVPAGKKIKEKTIFYSVSSPVCLVGEKITYILNYNNVNARIEGDNITLFKGKSSYNYGIGVSPDRKYILLGGLRNGTFIEVAGLKMTTFKIDKLPGWPEYFKGFGFAADGTGYAVTTAFRLIKINKTGVIEKAVPVY